MTSHSPRSLRLHHGLLMGLCALGLGTVVAKPAPPLPAPKVYSASQESAALEALTETQALLDKLDQKLLQAYGDDTIPIIRMERVKQGPALTEGPALAGGNYAPVPASATTKHPLPPVSPLKVAGEPVIRRIASLEPLTAACGLSSESIETLRIIADETGALLEKRHVAQATDRTDWLTTGTEDGSQRLASVHELNCGPVRNALKDTVRDFQSAYAKIYGALKQEPEADAPIATLPPSSATAAAVPAGRPKQPR